MKLKVLSYNIHKGFNWSNRVKTLALIKAAIVRTGADLVFLQEVVGERSLAHPKGHELDNSQYEYLADSIWQHYSYAKNAVYSYGHHGNVILSRWPIVYWNRQDISTNRWEQRGILYCNIEIPVGPDVSRARLIHAYCLHLNLLHRERLVQYGELYHRLTKDTQGHEPTIVAGDFNDWNLRSGDPFETRLAMEEVFKRHYGRYAKTFPAKWPLLSLDRMYIKNLTVRDAFVGHGKDWHGLSDHAPLFAELEFPDP